MLESFSDCPVGQRNGRKTGESKRKSLCFCGMFNLDPQDFANMLLTMLQGGMQP
jgi:hypothetical protein